MDQNVYVVSTVQVWDGDEVVTIDLVTMDKKVAKAKFNELVKNEKDNNEWWDKYSPAYDEFINSSDEFCCWEDGYFAENHIRIRLDEKTLE
jgi:hypothetical protein